tara:strand:- start:219 stop:1157 length:939 start_codon:yes stop_codon:yes gene_type:complete
MKADPLTLILDRNFEINKIFYMISGNEITLMETIRDLLIKKSKEKNSADIKKIKSTKEIEKAVGLFNKNSLYVLSEVKDIENKHLNILMKTNDVYIFFLENSPKIKSVKNIFLKRSDSLVLDCYELTKDSKTKIVKKYLDEIGFDLEQNMFWELVEKLDNKYGFLERELEKISELRNVGIKSNQIDFVVSKNNFNVERVFFQLFENNQKIINSFNDKVKNNTEINQLYYVIKQFSQLIINNDNLTDFEKNIPKYLFREKKFLMELFKRFNKNKKLKLLNLLFKTEKEIRKSSELSVVLGLRFILNFKKMTTF